MTSRIEEEELPITPESFEAQLEGLPLTKEIFKLERMFLMMKNLRTVALQMGPVEIPVGKVVQVRCFPQNLFKPTRFEIVRSEVARAVVIQDIKVGNQSQLQGTPDGLDGMVFHDPGERLPEIRFDVAEVGNQILVLVENVSSELVVFQAVMYGQVPRI